MARRPRRSVGIVQTHAPVARSVEQLIDRHLGQGVAALVAEIRAVDHTVEETKSQAQMQFEALQSTIQMLAAHVVRVESRLEQHLQRSALERAQIRQEVLAGQTGVDRCLQRLERR